MRLLTLCLIGSVVLTAGGAVATAQPEQVTNRFVSGTIVTSDLTPYTPPDGPPQLCFSAPKKGADSGQLFCYDGSSLRQITGFGDRSPAEGDGSSPDDLTVHQGVLYFIATDGGSAGTELWRYDGSGDPSLAADLNSGGGLNPVVFDDGGPSGANLYVTATDGQTGFELYRIPAGTAPLPVELASFDATADGESVRLTWRTASESGNTGFAVQRKVAESGETNEWAKVGYRKGAGTTSESQRYRFTDASLPYEADRLAYRLKQIDTDGTASYSEEVTVRRGVDELTLLGTFPNPARQRATVRFAVLERQEVTVRLYDVLGRRVRTAVRRTAEGRQETMLDVGDLSSGVYVLRLRAGDQTRTRKLTVVH